MDSLKGEGRRRFGLAHLSEGNVGIDAAGVCSITRGEVVAVARSHTRTTVRRACRRASEKVAESAEAVMVPPVG